MADDLPFKLKIMKSLYGMGMKNFGDSLLGELRRGSPEWMSFAGEILEGNDYPRRMVVLNQLVRRGFVEKSRQKDRLVAMLGDFLSSKQAIGDEKLKALKFVSQNLQLFPTEDDTFRGKIMSLQRDTDPKLASLAGELLPKIGIDLDDREMYRRN